LVQDGVIAVPVDAEGALIVVILVIKDEENTL
jgi:hypothetical protein